MHDSIDSWCFTAKQRAFEGAMFTKSCDLCTESSLESEIALANSSVSAIETDPNMTTYALTMTLI